MITINKNVNCTSRRQALAFCMKHTTWTSTTQTSVLFVRPYIGHTTSCGGIGLGQQELKTDMDFFPFKKAFGKKFTILKTHKTCSPSTHEGLLRVVPATFPGKQEHLTVWERSSIRFLLQHRWAAMTSHVPPSGDRYRHRGTQSAHGTD